jgi:hypothetical protein
MRVKEEGNGLAKTFKLWLFFFTKYSFSCDIGTWNPGPVLTKQVLYHWATSPSFKLCFCFKIHHHEKCFWGCTSISWNTLRLLYYYYYVVNGSINDMSSFKGIASRSIEESPPDISHQLSVWRGHQGTPVLAMVADMGTSAAQHTKIN